MRNMAIQSIIQNMQEILLLSKVYSNSDPETYLLLQIGIVMGTADFAIHASEPILNKKFESTLKINGN